MRKLIMWNLMSLDGFVEGPNRDISWHNDVWGPELEQLSIEQGKEIGAPDAALRRAQDRRRAALSRFRLAALQEAGRKSEAEVIGRRPAFDRRRHPALRTAH